MSSSAITAPAAGVAPSMGSASPRSSDTPAASAAWAGAPGSAISSAPSVSPRDGGAARPRVPERNSKPHLKPRYAFSSAPTLPRSPAAEPQPNHPSSATTSPRSVPALALSAAPASSASNGAAAAGGGRRLSAADNTSQMAAAAQSRDDAASTAASNRATTPTRDQRPITPRQLQALWSSASNLVKGAVNKISASGSESASGVPSSSGSGAGSLGNSASTAGTSPSSAPPAASSSAAAGAAATAATNAAAAAASSAPLDTLADGPLQSASEAELEVAQWPSRAQLPPPLKSDLHGTNLPLVALSADFNYEFGHAGAQLSVPLEFLDEDRFVYYYRDYLYKRPHRNYIALVPNSDSPVVYSVETPKGNRLVKVLVRTKRGDDRFFVPPERAATLAELLEHEYPELMGAQTYEVFRDDFSDALVQYEQTVLVSKQSKFGVIYQRDGQLDEDDYYGNLGHSVEFDEFLSWMGEKVPLRNWSQFRGGLNVTVNSTGTHSVYTTFEDVEIMFHVSTFIPFSPNDVQQVERKRHIGNDVVVIVFRDAKCRTPFDPSRVRSQFNHVFCVVQNESAKPGGAPRYRIVFVYKYGVAQHNPLLPDTESFERTDELRRWLLTKLINVERAAMYAPDFRSRLSVGRKQLLQELVDHYPPRKDSGSSSGKHRSVLTSFMKKSDGASK